MCGFKLLNVLLSSMFLLVINCIGWLFLVPISLFLPKNKKKIVVIGRDDGKFLDNSKYFFLQAKKYLDIGYEIIFITECNDVKKILLDQGLLVQIHPTKESVLTLLKSNVVVVDSVEWHKKLKFHLSFGAKHIQLWHGVGFKFIELDKMRNEVARKSYLSNVFVYYFRLFFRCLSGRHLKYDLVNTTSNFYLDQVFKPAFSSKYYTALGYSRNGFNLQDDLSLINIDLNIFNKLKQWNIDGKKIILIAPTFRESQIRPMNLDVVSLEELDLWCSKNGFIFIFKFHPSEKNITSINGNNIFQYDSKKDIYPLFTYTFAMVADYSSIYMDYLLLDKPIYYYVPDLEYYIANDHQLQFDYESMIAGEKLKSWEDLLTVLNKNDNFNDERIRLKKIVFEDIDQNFATKNIINFLKDKSWI